MVDFYLEWLELSYLVMNNVSILQLNKKMIHQLPYLSNAISWVQNSAIGNNYTVQENW